jgi:hypothetical protein
MQKFSAWLFKLEKGRITKKVSHFDTENRQLPNSSKDYIKITKCFDLEETYEHKGITWNKSFWRTESFQSFVSKEQIKFKNSTVKVKRFEEISKQTAVKSQ